MAQVINTNSLSLLTQNNLNKSQSALNTAIERLSSGMRINSAKDDAAGQAIANRFTANIKGLTQASRNANDGISIAQTTEGALTEVNNNLQRVRELSVQAATGTNSQSDLDSIQGEIKQRLDEINRVSEQTQFNGVKVLSADAGKLTVQVGANDGETIDIDLEEISAKTLGLESFNINGTGTVNKAATKDDLVLAGAAKGALVNGTQQWDVTAANVAATSANVMSKLATADTVTYTGTDSGFGLAATGNTYTYNSATSSFSFDVANVTTASSTSFLTPAAGGSKAATITIGGSAQDVLIDSAGKLTAADDGSILYLDTTGNLTKNGGGTLTQANVNGAGSADLATAAAAGDLLAAMSNGTDGVGGAIKVGGTTLTADAVAGDVFDVTGASISAAALTNLGNAGGYSATVAAGPTTYAVAANGAVTIGGAAAFVDAAGALTTATTTTTSYYEQSNGAVTDGAGNTVYADSAKAGAFTLNARSGSTSTADPLAALDEALSKVDKLRSSLGAVQNRFDSTIANLGTTITNLSSSRSRIEDADYAVEVSNMTRAQILQQAGTSVLSQANQTTQGVLSLLR
ncbi:FliC/FljB family flagellin [Variovorax saccharolyticus]|uniref:FliC/FljB family flagellin n=1 Tax=Variovorax saccharolyticus TaxID=3053516 RepID=UPI002577F4C7|nr:MULTISPECIES: FliC/FljB family flagellin [unclassified Variovorax]MDM0021298.1 FliC/FljB family flagellin [Variovorax sp. J22R187]MDM0027307.1 FliC/FljB family flagellin [Variovorax sp. J31P216]